MESSETQLLLRQFSDYFAKLAEELEEVKEELRVIKSKN